MGRSKRTLGPRRGDMATTATQVLLDTPAAEFRLPATDGKTYTLDDVAGEKGTVVVFICNHCPYVKAVIDRMVSDARVLMSRAWARPCVRLQPPVWRRLTKRHLLAARSNGRTNKA